MTARIKAGRSPKVRIRRPRVPEQPTQAHEQFHGNHQARRCGTHAYNLQDRHGPSLPRDLQLAIAGMARLRRRRAKNRVARRSTARNRRRWW